MEKHNALNPGIVLAHETPLVGDIGGEGLVVPGQAKNFKSVGGLAVNAMPTGGRPVVSGSGQLS